MRHLARLATLRTGALALATLSVITCTADGPRTGATDQAAINPPLPNNLNLVLHARTTVTVGPLSRVFGDVASNGVNGSVLFDVSASQNFGFGFHVLANTVTVEVNAQVGTVIGNLISVDGFANQQLLGLDPDQLPVIPATTAPAPGTTALSVAANQSKQACPGQYGVMSVGANGRLNLNGGVYHVTRLNLADGARLQPSEPVVIVVSGNLVTGTGAVIEPSPQAINPMTADDIRIEVGGAATIGENGRLRVHLLAPNGKFSTGRRAQLTGAAWARSISLASETVVNREDTFSAQAANVPPPCNDNNTCTADQCVATGGAAFCRNTPLATGTSCEDGNLCNGAEACDGAGTCDPGAAPAAGTSCADGDVCNGAETCDGISTCLAGEPPVINDANNCTTDACDPIEGVSNDPLPDGTTCSGVGVCEAGVCSVEGTVFSEQFFEFQGSPNQCNRWNDFLFNQLTSGTYSSITMSGTFDPFGVTCSDPTAATRICRALHNGGFDNVVCGGRTWSVGQCGGVELSIDSGICSCRFAGRTLRPCIGSESWGGVNTETCGGPTQNITVVCE